MSDALAPPKSPAPLALTGPRPGFGAGVYALFSGFGFILGSPSVWPLAMVPVAIALAAGAGLGALSIALLPAKIAAWIGATTAMGHALSWVLELLATVLAVALSLLLGVAVAQPLAGPALHGIVRRVDQRLGAPAWPPTSFGTDVLRGLASVALAAAVGTPILLLLSLVNVLFPPATVVTFPLKILVVAILVTWDLCDYPLSARGVPIRERVRFIGRNLTAVLGFGVGLALASVFLPCSLLLVLPAGVAGATRLTALGARRP